MLRLGAFPPLIAVFRVESDVFSIMIRKTLENSGTPLGARQTGRLFAVPQVYPVGHVPQGIPLLVDVLVDVVVVVVVVLVLPPVPVVDVLVLPPVPVVDVLVLPPVSVVDVV